MANPTWCFVQSRTRPYFAVQFLQESDRSVIDLTGGTVALNFRKKEDLTVAVNAGSCVVTDAANGKCEYRWGSSDLDVPGIYVAEFVITFSDATTQSVIIDNVEVREKLV